MYFIKHNHVISVQLSHTTFGFYIPRSTDYPPDCAGDVWDYASRTLSDFGTLVDDIWAAATRTITGGTITSNTDKTGYSLASGQLTVKKNTQLANFEFLIVQSSDHVTPATGKSVTATRSIDGGTFASCSNTVSEVGSGVYKITLAASDLNGDVITLKFAATGCDQRTTTILTQA